MTGWQFWYVWLYTRFMEGMGATLLLPFIIPLIWGYLPWWAKAPLYVLVLAVFHLMFVGMAIGKGPPDLLAWAEGVTLVLVVGPVFAWAIKQWLPHGNLHTGDLAAGVRLDSAGDQAPRP